MPNNYAKWTPEQRKQWNAFNAKYNKEHYATVTLKINRDTEKDIIDFLYDENGKPKFSLSGKIKSLIRKAIQEN